MNITVAITENREKSNRLSVYDRDNLIGRVTEALRLRPNSTKIWLNAYIQFESRIIRFSGNKTSYIVLLLFQFVLLVIILMYYYS